MKAGKICNCFKPKNIVGGFTLIELLVVIAIIGVLASVVLASLTSVRSKARDAKRRQDIHQLQVALDLYFTTYGSYPDSGSPGSGARESSCYTTGTFGVTPGAWVTPLTSLITSGYIGSLPIDPLNNGSPTGSTNPNYCYVYFTNPSMSDVYSSCKNTVTGDIVYPGSYYYIIYYSLENPPANRYQMNWNGASSVPSNTCAFGPTK